MIKQSFDVLTKLFVRFVERYYPDPFVFAILLTFATFVMAWGMTPTSVDDSIRIWGNGLPLLLEFIAQITLTLITAHALAHTDLVHNLLSRLGRIPANPLQAYALVVMVSGLCSLLAWSMGLIAGALIAKEVAKTAASKSIRLHYPLLVASAYSGFVVWHMGYSSSAALFVATPGHLLESKVGLIPVTETIFTGWNIAIALITLVTLSVVCAIMHPSDEDIIELDSQQHDEPPDELALLNRPAEYLERSVWLSRILGCLFLVFLGLWFQEKGFSLNLNIVNWSFLGLGLILARSPVHYISLVTNAGKSAGPIILQYPFYAGIMALMSNTGLVSIISGWFTNIATQVTLPFWAFIAGGVINFFIPSGGGQWAVQGPIFIESAGELNVDPALIVMAVAYGDQWSNMIQPFWTIPLLAVAGLRMKEIMGYSFVVFLVTSVLFGGGLIITAALRQG